MFYCVQELIFSIFYFLLTFFDILAFRKTEKTKYPDVLKKKDLISQPKRNPQCSSSMNRSSLDWDGGRQIIFLRSDYDCENVCQLVPTDVNYSGG